MPSSYRRPRNRRPLVERGNNPPTAVNISSATKSGSVLTMNFDRNVTLNGFPAMVTGNGTVRNAISAEQVDGNTVDVTFDGSLASATTIDITPFDPAIRGIGGAFVCAKRFPVS